MNPVAIITGSSRGIGRGIALELAQHGHDIVVNFVRNSKAANEVVAEIEAVGAEAIAVAANVGEAGDRQLLIEKTIENFGRIDVLVNNAGITSPGRMDLLEASEENWDLVFDTNLKGPFFLAQLAAKEMIRLLDEQTIGSGTIINVSSISAYAVSTNRADYCIAKSAMQMMTWLFADRLAHSAIRVYEICPGIIASDMTEPVKEKYDKLIAAGLYPIPRWGTPEDVGRAVRIMISGEFPFTTGDRINVDGGFHIRRL